MAEWPFLPFFLKPQAYFNKKAQNLILFKEIIKINKSSTSNPGVNVIIPTPTSRDHPFS